MGKLVNLTGQKFNRLTVLERDKSRTGKDAYWICQCDCGNIVSVQGTNLRNGHSKSCGCLKKEIISKYRTLDLTGQQFGYLTVLKKDTIKISGYNYWICKCNCGNITSVSSHNLRNGGIISCGCYKNSKGEDKIKELLIDLKINFIQQKTFNNLKYKNNLKFDFFLPDNNCCIEYNGKQHYQAVEYFGGEEQFKKQKEKDDIKRQWCKDNNIKLIEIPYWDYNKLNQDYLKELIQIK